MLRTFVWNHVLSTGAAGWLAAEGPGDAQLARDGERLTGRIDGIDINGKSR